MAWMKRELGKGNPASNGVACPLARLHGVHLRFDDPQLVEDRGSERIW